MNKAWLHGILAAFLFSLSVTHAQETKSARQVISEATPLTDDSDAQVKMIQSLTGLPDPEVEPLLTAWKEGSIYLVAGPDGKKIAVTLAGDPDATKKEAAIRLDTKEPLKDAAGTAVRVSSGSTEVAETDSSIRRAMKAVTDLAKLTAPDAKDRLMAISQLGMERDLAKLPILEGRLKVETDSSVKRAVQEAIALTRLKSPDVAVKIQGCLALADLHPLSAKDSLESIIKEADKTGDKALLSAAQKALSAVESHRSTVNFFGTIFRGFSLGSVLLVVAIGLAITFGLMGVINMAHGELIAVGAYTTYVVQCVFADGLALSPFGMKVSLPGMHTTGWAYEMYFVVALPMAFIMAALVGLALERGVIRFLYRRPLESLLATWGVSLVLQQLFRLIFGANNVQVNSPSWLSDNWTINDVILGWNRVFVIGFAILIVVGTWALLSKTPLGLLIRAVMQNRNMAACLGVRTERVNMLTFGFGSGLAGLAGAFLSQIGNVGPGLGQNYIVDAFMTVVVGGVGSLIGTVASALGIGVLDQSLQQVLGNPVLGKILVLGGIILFLQWRPAGLFATKTRSLES